MAGYSTDQFFNFAQYEDGSLTPNTQDNPNFAYPGNRAPNVYDRAGDKTNYNPGVIQRGFIRGIFPEILQEAATNTLNKAKKTGYENARNGIVSRRCFFQFNPSLILRSVEASTTVLNPLLQPATELLQPIPGQAAFEFQLLFNREREVSNDRMASGFNNNTGDPTMSPTTTAITSLTTYGVGDNAYSQQHVSELGVLTDLYILDSIIGQSITQDSIAALTSYWDITQKNKVATKSTVENQDGTKTETTNNTDGSVEVKIFNKSNTLISTEKTDPVEGFGDFDFTSDETKRKLESVLGNSAFLSPLPVRIVFSSLFMVEGFVTSSNVAFHKFNSKMVPTVCSVTLNVQALYLGFAKKDSYVSQQLATQLQASADLKADDLKARAIAQEGLREGLKVNLTSIIPHGSTSTNSLNAWWSNGVTNNWTYVGREIGARFDSTSRPGLKIYITENLRKLVKKSAVQNIKIDKIELLFLNKDNLPPKYKDVRLLQNSLDKGIIPGKSRTGKKIDILRTEINIITDKAFNNNPNGSGINGIPPVTFIESAKIENSGIGAKDSKNKPLRHFWQSAPLTITPEPTDHFGTTNIMVVMLVQMSCNYTSGTQDISAERVRITKSVILDNVNPTTKDFIEKNSGDPRIQSGLSV
jgi:hypothetical protein